MPTYEDLTGQKFGRLTITKKMPNDKHYNTMWLCKCDCGNETVVHADSLKNGHTKSCGCLNKENNSHPLPLGVAAFECVLSSYKHRAKKKKLEWGLTKKQFRGLTQQDCYYCGVRPNNKLSRKDCNGVYVYNGIDRIDNTKGYIIDNVVSCCKRCNQAKNNQTLNEFQDWIIKVYNRMKGDD